MGKPTSRLVVAATLVAGLILIAASFVFSDNIARNRAVAEADKRGDVSAELLASALEREHERFRLATLVLAQDADARAVLEGDDGERLGAFNKKLEALSRDMGAAAIYLLDLEGLTLASSNYIKPETFVGQNYGFRSYFREAIRNGHHEQFALGTVSRRPGLYISRQLQAGGKPIGVIVSKVEFDNLEAEWRKAGVTVFATNANGVILITSNRDWRFKTVQPVNKATQNKMLRDLDYGPNPLEVLPIYQRGQVGTIEDTNIASKKYAEAVKQLANDWQLHVLTETQESIRVAVASSRISVLASLLALFALGLAMMYLRRSAAFKAERNLAIQQRDMSERLVQLNKLAALGQIAAGVGHEINQPLAAISAYTSNAVTFLDRGQTDDVRDNLNRVIGLASRIGAITAALLGFARKATGTITAVSLNKVIEGALLLLRDRIATLNAVVHQPKDDALVQAEAVRLEQVLVNLMANALDAGQSGVEINLSIELKDGFVELTVADNGPGLSMEMREALFQPFSTTKRDGLGLGLVISRDIMADFGGELVATTPEHGAAFVMRLRPAT
ncbi:ATP-binding protein [Aquidulcibacter sp.]|jgi:two-component system C4-dicarboxylate transport sensor histidine kinase DctB|uniref:sensor histidine kinase n=1 Tax=Aquidulcibacter sp. TaxID=2052990 RepID=UPI0028A7AFDE|nr:ATP-binding protein [Aquidulcibacter sp.]